MRQCERCGTTMAPMVARTTVGGQKVCADCQTTARRMAALNNPISDQTNKHPQEWFHGSGHDYDRFDDPAENSPLRFEEQNPHSVDTSHWNTLLGSHFTSDHRVAQDFAEGQHASGMNSSSAPVDHVIHAKLHLKNPKVYDSEHEMDQEVHEHEHRAGNTIHSHFAHENDEDDEDWDGPAHQETYGSALSYAKDQDRPFGKDDYENFHPKATGWLNHHPDKYDIAGRFKQRLKDQGHDGIVYGNEYEASNYGKSAQSAIAFEPGQIEITQHHYGKQGCLSEEEAKRRTPMPGQQMMPGTEHLQRELPKERARPDTSLHWPRTWTPSFFDNKKISARAGEDTGRLWAPLPKECWDCYYGRHTGATLPHGEQSALNEMGKQDVYAVRSGDSMVNLCEYHRDVHVGNSQAADALGEQLGLNGRERSAEPLGGARKGACAACGKDTAYQLKLLTPPSMRSGRGDRLPTRRRQPYLPTKTKTLEPLRQSENVRQAAVGDMYHANAGGVRYAEDGGPEHWGDHIIPAGSEVHANVHDAWGKAIEHWNSGKSDFPRVYTVHDPQAEHHAGKMTLRAPSEGSEVDHDHEEHPALRSSGEEEHEPIMFHGTTRYDSDDHPEEITAGGSSTSFGPGTSDSDYAYATPSLGNAWSYAEKRSQNGGGGKPTVYRVTPHKPEDVEEDPQWHGDTHRGNYAGDKRSKSGFEVLDEVPMSGKQESEWKRSPFNDEDHGDDDDDWGRSHYGVKTARGDDDLKGPIEMTASKKLPTLRMLAHDATEDQELRHCPFCGSGKIIGRQDGSVECEFCHGYFTVQTQPQFPNFPQTINGAPQSIPGMPGQVETPGGDGGFPPGGDDEAAMGEEQGEGPPWAQAPTDGPSEETDEGAESASGEEPPPFAKKSFRTATGARLTEEDYVRHLAIALAPDRSAMIRRIAAERGAS